jgi:flavodoxin
VDRTRRSIVMAALTYPLSAGTFAASAQGVQRPDRKTLIAYFSRSGNTRVVAGQISRSRGGDLFEIEPATPYPADYFETVEQARQERDSGYEPPLQSTLAGMAEYRTLFLCFPIWGETAPPAIRSFLSAHDLAGKTVIPAVLHGGYGLGGALNVLRSHAPQARLVDGFVLEGPQERQTAIKVGEWLDTLKT